jgi:pimeloyl-ACP methyl ester carboxylesterase
VEAWPADKLEKGRRAMSRLIHMRGDLLGMFIFFIFFFLGLWQVIVAWKRLNGLSFTGRPDRKAFSYVLGLLIMAGSLAWYFSRKGHFASPDLEGIETLVVMVGGLVVSTALEFALAWLATSIRSALRKATGAVEAVEGNTEQVTLEVAGESIPCTLYASRAKERSFPVLLLHDYGGARGDLGTVASSLSSRGHDTLCVDLDGHGDNPRAVDDPSMGELLGAAADLVKGRSAGDSVAAVGVGLGGLLAMGMVSSDLAARSVAIDPPARDAAGHHDVDSMRESGIAGVLAEFLRPSARGVAEKRVSLSRLVASLPAEYCEAAGESMMTIIGTSQTWFNAPEALKEFAFLCSPFEPVLIKGSHESLPLQDDTIQIVSGVLSQPPGPTARRA